MGFQITFSQLKKIYDVWDLRVAVLVSLAIQILLIFIASSRKRTNNTIITMCIWVAYLLADSIAIFAIGLIFNGSSNTGKTAVNKDLMVLWAPFLLLHLGGPDTITAFSLEDNELWVRHMFELFIQISLILYVFKQSLPNKLWVPTMLVYIAGIIKYAERTRALFLASMGNIKKSMLPPSSAGLHFARFRRQYRSKFDASSVRMNIISPETAEGKPPDCPVEGVSSSMDDIMVVQTGYRFFNDYRGLIVDLTFGFREWQKTREFFFRTPPEDALRIMEVELNFMYDLLYTKRVVVFTKCGFILRFFCLVLTIIALGLFVSHHKHNELDICITYTLLIGAIILDVLATFKLIFSDWTIIKLSNIQPGESSRNRTVRLVKLFFRIQKNLPFSRRPRWSRSASQHSLITYCLKRRCKLVNKVVEFFGVEDLLDEMQYKGTKTLCRELTKFVFRELWYKAVKAKTSKEAKAICSWRGEKVLLEASRFYPSLSESVEVEYDESVLRWHIATEICYYKTEDDTDSKDDQHRQFCKILSRYMWYLWVMRPTMMSAEAGVAQIRFRDTCEVATEFFRSNEQAVDLKEACALLFNADPVSVPKTVKRDTSRSVLFDACIMAKDLQKFEAPERWQVMSKVWVELLSYAASHCKAHAHAQQLSKGGEFVTFVWLLMIHFGMGEPFQTDS